ncbi:RNA-binding protein 8A [Eurytemora carolleeae]|uniref:RNA-binding protein 8A n=1 Tax=Eurytemora carolleeae TaxID=1294199 RepID=UPI000C78FC7C|nr:RNA-binding protein 8A [Eurytemora carolleeae]|eukprot:XP_023330048.1 RNA-binding protein 8A-like [Eurytemora affinis]
MPNFGGEGCKLFVYGVSTGTPKEEIQDEFERFGEVTDTYNSGKGYAFVTFSSKESAEQAREGMNGQTIGGQEIKVRICGCRAGRSQDLAGGRGQDSTWSGTN